MQRKLYNRKLVSGSLERQIMKNQEKGLARDMRKTFRSDEYFHDHGDSFTCINTC